MLAINVAALAPIYELTPEQLEWVSGGLAGKICRGGVATR